MIQGNRSERTYSFLFFFGKRRLEFEQDNVDECHDEKYACEYIGMLCQQVGTDVSRSVFSYVYYLGGKGTGRPRGPGLSGVWGLEYQLKQAGEVELPCSIFALYLSIIFSKMEDTNSPKVIPANARCMADDVGFLAYLHTAKTGLVRIPPWGVPLALQC